MRDDEVGRLHPLVAEEDEIVDSASEALDFRSGGVTPQLLAFLAP